MLDTLFGWYIQENLKGRYITITFEQSLTPDKSDTLTIDDAEDGATLKSWLTTDNFILHDVFAYADPGFVKIEVLPDSDPSKKFRVEATKNATRTPIMPPKMVEVDLALDYENESQLNNLYVSFTAMRIPEDNLDDFTLLSELLPTSLYNIDIQTLNATKYLANLQALQQGVSMPYSELGPEAHRGVEPSRVCRRRR